MKPEENNIKKWNKKWVFLVYLRKTKEYLDVRFSMDPNKNCETFWEILPSSMLQKRSKQFKSVTFKVSEERKIQITISKIPYFSLCVPDLKGKS